MNVKKMISEIKNESESENKNIMDPDDAKKLKGDAIGDTIYSERFVLKTLLQLQQIDWNEELENDLCYLWDMTTEKDVVDFLLLNNFLELSIDLIKDRNEVRLIEIIIGIIGNMCVYSETCLRLQSLEDLDTIFRLITSSDAPILIQLMRLYKALLFSENLNYDFINAQTLQCLNFILYSSQNSELLVHTLYVVSELARKRLLKPQDISLLEMSNQALLELSKRYEDDNYLCNQLEKEITAYVKVLEHICAWLAETVNVSTLELSNNFSNSLLEAVELIFKFCTHLETVREEPAIIEYFIYNCLLSILFFQLPFTSNFLKRLLHFHELITINKINFESDINDKVNEVLEHFLSKGDLTVLESTIKSWKWKKSKLKFLLIDHLINEVDCNDEFVLKINHLCNVCGV